MYVDGEHVYVRMYVDCECVWVNMYVDGDHVCVSMYVDCEHVCVSMCTGEMSGVFLDLFQLIFWDEIFCWSWNPRLYRLIFLNLPDTIKELLTL